MSEKHDEQKIRQLQKLFRKHGITVRRENLSRGPSFRVKSGGCTLTGERIIFVDRRLPPDQQLNTLLDQLVAADFSLSQEDVDALPAGTKSFLERSANTTSAM